VGFYLHFCFEIFEKLKLVSDLPIIFAQSGFCSLRFQARSGNCLPGAAKTSGTKAIGKNSR